jgi:Na+-translocating ferredoxin:NAD+ oxidoreductase subunit D
MAEQTKPTSPSAPAPDLHVAPGPHLQDRSLTTRRFMLDVIIGLSPLMLASLIVFRQFAAIQMGLCIAFCCVAEFLWNTIRRRPFSLGDLSASVTGLILALSLPWNAPIYVTLIASFIGIWMGKMIFGGVGMNLFNPAMVGRAFVMLSFAGAMGAPAYVIDVSQIPGIASLLPADALTGATPMTALKMAEAGEGGYITALLPLLLGNTIGSLGETSALACVLGGLYLCIRRTASWEIPLGVILAAAVIAVGMELYDLAVEGVGVAGFFGNGSHWGVASELCGGALLFGAFFIATDPVTSPLTPKGKFIFGLGVGCFVMLIRKLSVYPEGVMFAILLMNSLTPLINRWTIPKPFGGAIPDSK